MLAEFVVARSSAAISSLLLESALLGPCRPIQSEGLAESSRRSERSGEGGQHIWHPGGMPERCDPCGVDQRSVRVPVVSLRSTTGYFLASLRLAGPPGSRNEPRLTDKPYLRIDRTALASTLPATRLLAKRKGRECEAGLPSMNRGSS